MHRQRITALIGTGALSLLVAGQLALEPAAVASSGAGATASASAPATVQLVAPKPTSTAASPEAPDPHPPLGGQAPDGSVPGGAALSGRGLILPTGAPKLPAGLTAHAWVLADLDTGEILAARDPHGRYQPASILKALTAVTILPHLPGNKAVTVSPAAATAEGSALGLLAGARYSVDELFGALLLVSANDAAQALAEANGGVARTVSQMNAEAAALGAYDTYVQTPSGLDGWQQLTSAYDMTLVLRAALNEPRFVKYDELPFETMPAKASKYGRVGLYQFDNQSLDFLQGMPGALVAKTGYTDAARHTFLCAAKRGVRRLGVVFLRNERRPLDQYQQAEALLNWGFRLPSAIAPVGELAGPIAPAVRSATPGEEGSVPVHQPQAASQQAEQRPPRYLQASVGVTGGLLAIFAGFVAARRRTRRRSPRRY